MVRTESIKKVEESNLALPLKNKGKNLSKSEINELVLKLAEAHGLI